MKHIDLAGLAGFALSGVLFVISAIRTGDPFALAGSIVWLASCVGWIIAIVASSGK